MKKVYSIDLLRMLLRIMGGYGNVIRLGQSDYVEYSSSGLLPVSRTLS